jgi:hypothetical protein
VKLRAVRWCAAACRDGCVEPGSEVRVRLGRAPGTRDRRLPGRREIVGLKGLIPKKASKAF